MTQGKRPPQSPHPKEKKLTPEQEAKTLIDAHAQGRLMQNQIFYRRLIVVTANWIFYGKREEPANLWEVANGQLQDRFAAMGSRPNFTRAMNG